MSPPLKKQSFTLHFYFNDIFGTQWKFKDVFDIQVGFSFLPHHFFVMNASEGGGTSSPYHNLAYETFERLFSQQMGFDQVKIQDGTK